MRKPRCKGEESYCAKVVHCKPDTAADTSHRLLSCLSCTLCSDSQLKNLCKKMKIKFDNAGSINVIINRNLRMLIPHQLI